MACMAMQSCIKSVFSREDHYWHIVEPTYGSSKVPDPLQVYLSFGSKLIGNVRVVILTHAVASIVGAV